METAINGSGTSLTILAALWNNSLTITGKDRIWAIILTQSKKQENVLPVIVTELKKIILPCD